MLGANSKAAPDEKTPGSKYVTVMQGFDKNVSRYITLHPNTVTGDILLYNILWVYIFYVYIF